MAECLFLIKTSIPKPELTSKPPHKAPKERFPPTNNSVNKSDDAQLGIKPIIQENRGDMYLFTSKNAAKLSSPTKPMIKPKTRLIIKT